MKTFKHIILVGLIGLISSFAALSLAADQDMTEGEIKKIDKDNKKLTIKHGEIKNLDMPGMTMLFQVREAAMLDRVKPGDKVKFKVENIGGAIVVTEIQLAK